MSRLKSAAAIALFLGIGACTGDAGSPLAPEGQPVTTISDAAHAGAVPGFYFLPPMVPNPSYSGTFDGQLQPTVQICELAGTVCGPVIAQYSTTSGTGGEKVQVGTSSYQVNWKTSQFNLDPARHYRISVYAGTVLLGFADVDVVATGKELKNVNTQEYIPLQDDRTLPIKFRIETGIAGQVIVSPASAEVPAGGTQQFTATVLDLHGNPLACSVAWSSDNTAAATVDANGLATGVAPGSATIKATCQAASGSATLTVFNPNTPPVGNDDAFEAIGNVTVPVAAPGVLANDTDGENNPLQAVPGTYPTTAGGSVTIDADGSFSYLSAAGYVGPDSFSYTVTDGADSVTATATMTSTYRVWYVDNAAAAPGDGRDASPFNALAGAEAASTAGETVFVRTGAAPYDGGFTLKTSQSLTGQGVPSSVTATLNGQTVVLLAAGSAPTITQGSGATIQLATNNVVQGVDVTSAAGAGIAGSGFGTLTVGSVSVSATGGPALDLSSGDVAGSFGALSSAGSAGAGIRLLGVGGSFSAAGGSITGSAGAGVDVTGGAGTFSYGGDVAVVGPLAVWVTGRTGGALTFGGTIASTGSGISVQNNSGGSIAFTGSSKSLSTGANPGVSLANNTGATISFGGGGLVIGTTTGTGFEAIGGGTISATGAGNTVSSAGGVAVRVENTTIGAAGLTFRSVSANGGTNGIVLNNTGAVSGIQVTGTGAAGSGGTIQGMSGDGVRLDNATDVQLSSMVIQSNAGNGIGGANVTGFVLDGGSTVLNNADNAAADEAGIRFDNLLGTAAITGSTVSGSVEDNVRIVNTSGSLSLSVNGSTVRDNNASTGQEGLRLVARGNAQMTANVSGSHFIKNRGTGVSATTEAAGILDVTVTGGSLQNNFVGVNLVHGSTGALTFDVLSIPVITGHGSSPVNINRLATAGTASTFSGTVSGNAIGTSGVPGSGSAAGSGVRAVSNGAGGTLTVAVTGNTIREVNSRGVDVLARDGSSTINANITGNTIALTSSLALEGIRVDAGALTTDAVKVCAAISGNTVTTPFSSAIRVRQRFTLTTFNLAGYAGAPADNAAVAAFLASTNTAAPVTADNGGPGFTGVASCPTP